MQLTAMEPIGRMVAIGLVVLVVGLGVALVSYLIGIYNELVALRNDCDQQFANVDVVLKQRHDELPKLIDTCKGYMQYEQKTLEAVTDARSAYTRATTPEQKADADNQITGALKTLFAVAENYPDLKADSNFLQLQSRITGLEDKIAGQRGVYNLAANEYNIRIAQVPANFVAAFAHFLPRPMYPVPAADREDVKVSFA
jgi:LemA protein